jgi:apolipoprotein N-acyltransferase
VPDALRETPRSFAKPRLEEFAGRLAGLKRWRRFGAAFTLGVISAFAFSPFYAMPLLWLVYPCLVWMLNGATTHRQAFGIGWAFGLGQFGAGLYWLTNSMFTDIAHWWWAVPFASTILPILLGFIPGFSIMMWWRMRLTGGLRLAGLAAWLMIGEWIRGHFLTGFPWNLTAQGWIAWLPILQSFSFLGAYALGFVTVWAASTISLLGTSGVAFKKGAVTVVAGVAVFGLLAAWGEFRLSHDDGATVPGINIRLVQPNVSQSEKSSRELAREHFATLIRLSRQPTATGDMPNVVIWSETAVPYLLDLSPEIPRAIGSALTRPGWVLAGTLRREPHGEDKWDYFNSLQVIDHDGNELAHYDKTHLAPFGEYMPFRNILHLDALAVGSQDLTPGSGAETVSVPGLPPFSPMICYEAIFPETIVDPAHRPDWLVQITNDGWFGISPGPHQHFAMARARAVEQGLPLMRAGNTGVSGAIDPYGRIIGVLGLGEQGILDVPLPRALPHQPFYSLYGDVIFAGLEALFFLTVAIDCGFRRRSITK